MNIRACEIGDVPAVQAIYAHHVLHGTGSFEEGAPSLEEMQRRFVALQEGNFPFLVAEADGEISGYAYAGPYRTRVAYRYSCENAVYVAPHAHRCGVGYALMVEVIAQCRSRGLRQMIAVIGDSANDASIGLHTRLGFRHVGTFRNVGFKFDRWLDTVLMQLEL